MAKSLVRMQRDGYTMVVLPRWRALFDRMYAEGEIFDMEGIKPRNMSSHRHYFASVKTAWDNLPEEKMREYPSPEHLRKRALIVTGYCTIRDHICETEEQANSFQAFLGGLLEYDFVERKGNIVRVYSPRSQSEHAMDGDEFRKSKRDVLDALARLLGTSTNRLHDAGKREDK